MSMFLGRYVAESDKLTLRCLWFWVCTEQKVMSMVIGQYIAESDKLLLDVYGYN